MYLIAGNVLCSSFKRLNDREAGTAEFGLSGYSRLDLAGLQLAEMLEEQVWNPSNFPSDHSQATSMQLRVEWRKKYSDLPIIQVLRIRTGLLGVVLLCGSGWAAEHAAYFLSSY